MTIRKSISRAVRTFQRSKNHNKRPQSPICDTFGSNSTAIGEKFPKNYSESSIYAPPAPLSPVSSFFSGSAYRRRFARFCCHIAFPVLIQRRDDYDEAEEINWMIMSNPDGDRGKAVPTRKKKNVALKKHRKARPHASLCQESFQSPCALQSDAFEKNEWREQPEAVSRSASRCCFRSLKKIRAVQSQRSPWVQAVESPALIDHLPVVEM